MALVIQVQPKSKRYYYNYLEGFILHLSLCYLMGEEGL